MKAEQATSDRTGRFMPGFQVREAEDSLVENKVTRSHESGSHIRGKRIRGCCMNSVMRHHLDRGRGVRDANADE